jgi:hypothetical protein
MATTQNAVVAITYGDVPGFPADAVVDHITVTATPKNPANSNVVLSVAEGVATVTLPNLAPDTWTITAQGFPAAGGAGWGVAASATIVIVSTATVSLHLPASLVVTQP